MNWVEIIGVTTGALSVWLAARQNWLTWPVGLVNVALFVVMFSRAALYSDVLLHVAYLGLSVYGWVKWGTKDELKVTRMDADLWWLAGLNVVGGTILLAAITDALGSSYPLLDSLVTCLSLLACYLMSRKVLESWLIYIVSDIVAIAIYLAKGLNLTAALYTLYLVLCIQGYRSWKRSV